VMIAMGAAPVRAQLANRLSLGGGGASARLRAATPGAAGTLSGITAFGTGRISLRRFALQGEYRQGSLTPDSGTGTGQDLVEARLLAAMRPLPWLQIAAGPHLRAYVVPGSTERWVFLEGRVRAEGAVIGEMVVTHLEMWTAFSSKVNVPGGASAARGGEVGLTVRFPRSPIWARLTYAIDRAALTGNARVETLEDVAISVGFGRP
jgi:hypothetical protein